MQLCYLDESGDTTILRNSDNNVQPVHVILAIFLGEHELSQVTKDFLRLKKKTYPHLGRACNHSLDWATVEVKGADVRSDWVSCSPDKSRRAKDLLDGTLGILESAHAKLVGRVLIKGFDTEVNETRLYTSSVQCVFKWFNSYMIGMDDRGMVIADNRSKTKNVNLAHSVFTQKFQATGDSYTRVVEMPVFGNSENHVGIQMTDLLCSAIISPMAIYTYCNALADNRFKDDGYESLKQEYSRRINRLQFREKSGINERLEGGLIVNNMLTGCAGSYLFQEGTVSSELPVHF